MDCTGIADASTEFEFKIVEFSPMVTAYLFEAGRDYYYIGKFICLYHTILMIFRIWNLEHVTCQSLNIVLSFVYT